MTRESMGWIVAGVVVVLACTLGAMQQQGAVGRYQLIESRYQIVNARTTTDHVSIWRIDTVTGATVLHQAFVSPNGDAFGWQAVGDFPAPK